MLVERRDVMGGYTCLLAVCIFFLSLKITSVQGKGRLAVQIAEYRNPGGRDYNGDCCDGPKLPTVCLVPCDLSFHICLLSDVKNGSCTNFQRFTTPGSQNSVVFTDQKSTLFDFDIWQGEESVVFEVYDEDEDLSTLLDVFHLNYSTPTAGRNSSVKPVQFALIGLRTTNPSNLTLKVKVYCDQYYYGNDCAKKCVDADNCGGHYTCDENGGRICNRGWSGADCVLVLSGSPVDCDTYNQDTALRLDTWVGTATCPGGHVHQARFTIEHIGGTRVESSLTLENVTYTLVGKAVSGFLVATEDVNVANNISLAGQLRNSTYFLGTVGINSLQCQADFHSISVFSHVCGVGGQCIRYGQKKQQHYCCCQDGHSSANACDATTTQTTIHVTSQTSKVTSANTSIEITSPTITPSPHMTVITTPGGTTHPGTSGLTTESQTSTNSPATSSVKSVSHSSTTKSKITTETGLSSSTSKAPSSSSSTGVTNSTPSNVVTTTGASESSSTLSSTLTTTTSTTAAPVSTTATSTTSPPVSTTATSTTSPAVSTTATSTTLPSVSTTASSTTPPSVSTTLTSTSLSTTNKETFSPSHITTASPDNTTSPISTTIASTGKSDLTSTSSKSSSTSASTQHLTKQETPTTKTTSAASTTEVSTVTSTTAKSPTTTSVLSEGEKFTLALLLAAEELALLKDKLLKELLNIWKNYNHLDRNSNVTATSHESEEAIDEDGQDVMVTEYTIQADDDNNTTPLRVPPQDVIHKNLSAALNVKVHSGSKLILKNTTHHVYLSNFSPYQARRAEMNIHAAWDFGRNLQGCPGCFIVTIVKSEEYIRMNIESIYKIYYLVKYNATIITPNNTVIISPALEEINAKMKIDRQTYEVVFNLTGIHRYRFHYDLFIEDFIYESSYSHFQRNLEHLWKSLHTDATDITISILGTEKYIGDNKIELVSLLYYVYIGGHIYSPHVLQEPAAKDYQSAINVTAPVNSAYIVYIGTIKYRMKFSMSIFVKDLVDVNDLPKFKTQFDNHWKKKGNYIVEDSLPTTVLITTYSTYVTRIAYFIVKNHRIYDGRHLQPVYTGINVKKGSGQSYKIYPHSLAEPVSVAITKHFSFFIAGEITSSHSSFEILLKAAWRSYISEEFSVQLRWQELYENIQGNAFSRFYYVILYRGHIVDASKDLHNITAITESFKHRLEIHYTGLHVYQSIRNAFSHRYSFQLSFSTKLAKLDYVLLKNYIKSLWMAKWTGFTHCNCLQVTIIPQTEYYHPIGSQKEWNIHYYLQQSTKLVYPAFVTNQISSVWNYTTVRGEISKLSKVEMKSLYAFSYHHSIYFHTRPSKLDWTFIHDSLTSAWTTQLHANVTIVMKEFLEHKTSSGSSIWQLVYFIKKEENLQAPSVTGNLNMSFLEMHFTNAYGKQYKPFNFVDTDHWLSSYAFNIFANTSLSLKYHLSFLEALKTTWGGFLAGFKNTTYNVKVIMGNQIPIKISDSKYVWKIPVFLWYNQHIVDSSTWPLVDTDKLAKYFGHKLPVAFYPCIDKALLLPQFHFYFNPKVSPEDLKHVEESIKKEYCQQQKSEDACENVTVKVTTQEQTFDHKGDSHWKVQFTVSSNGSVSHPADVGLGFKFNASRLTEEINTNASGGPYHVEHIAPTSETKYLSKKELDILYLSHWVSEKNAEKIKQLVEKQLTEGLKEALNTTSNVTVNVFKPKEYVTDKGKSVWGLPLYVKVNGTIVPISMLPAIDLDCLEATLNHTLPNGEKLSVLPESQTVAANKLLGVIVNHKVPTSLYGKMEAAFSSYWKHSHGYTEHDHVKVTIKKQEEFIDKKGHSFWKLLVALSVNGTSIEGHEKVTHPEHGNIFGHVTGPNGVTYSTNTGSGLTSTKDFLSIYVDKHVAEANKHQIEDTIKKVMLKTNNETLENSSVNFQRQVEFVDKQGHHYWRWDFTVSKNGHHIKKELLRPMDVSGLKVKLKSISGPAGQKYGVVNINSKSLMQNNTLFALYVTPKVTASKIEEFERQLTHQWQLQHPGWSNLSVKVVTQEEVVVNWNGKSMWKLVYSLHHDHTSEDSRLIDNLNATLQKNIVVWRPGREGTYQIQLHHKSLLRYSSLFELHLNNKLSHTGLNDIGHMISSGLMSSNPGLNGKVVVVRPIRQEEYVTSKGSTVWKLVYSLNVDGVAYLPLSLYNVNASVVDDGLRTLNGPMGQNYHVISGSNLYNYRNHFSVFFKHKSIKTSLTELKNNLEATWTEHFKGIRNQSSVVINRVEEVIDHSGNTLWKIVYFLKSDDKIVEPVIVEKPHIDLIQHQIENMTSPAGSKFYALNISESTTVRTSELFTLYSSHQLNVESHKILTQSLKATWNICSDRECKREVVIRRQDRYISRIDKAERWAIRYSLHEDNTLLEPLLQSLVDATHVKKIFAQSYTAETVEFSTTLDRNYLGYHYHFPIFLTREIKQIEFNSLFSNPVKNAWADVKGIAPSHVNVSILGIEEWVDTTGKSFWKMICFIFENATVVDSEIEVALNTTLVKHEMQQTHRQILVDTAPKDLFRYTSSFSLFLKNAVKLEDSGHIISHLKAIWMLELQGSVESNITAMWSRQESYVGEKGTFMWKVVYFLLRNTRVLISSGLKLKNVATLQERLSNLNTYYTMETHHSSAVKAEDLFSFHMNKPILLHDKITVVNHLKHVATAKYSGVIDMKIVNQIAGIDSKTGHLVWRVFTSITKDGTLLRASIEEKIEHSSLKAALNITRGNTGLLYKTHLVQESSSFIQLTKIFTLYVRQQVARTKYSEFEKLLLNKWQQKLTKENIAVHGVKVEIVGQQKLVISETSSNRYIAGWRLMYTISTTTKEINAENIWGINMHELQSSIHIVSPSNKKYTIVSTVYKSFRLDQLYSVVLSKRIFKMDHEKFEGAIKKTFSEGIFKLNITMQIVRTEEVVRIGGTSESLWRHIFVVHYANSDGMVDANTHDIIQLKELQTRLDFSAADLTKYVAVYTNNQQGIVEYSSEFSLYFKGRIPVKKHQHILDLVKTAWQNTNTTDAKNINIMKGLTEEYIGDKGTVVSKIGYFVESMGSYVTGDTDKAPSFEREHFGDDISSLYHGGDLHRYVQCYTVTIRRRSYNIKTEEIVTSLTKIWNEHSEVKASGHAAKIHVLAKKQFIGQYGVHVTKMLYTVSLNSDSLEPNYILSPAQDAIQTAAEENHYTWHLYTHWAYRKSSLFSITFSGAVQKSVTAYIVEALTESWEKEKIGVQVQLIGMASYSPLSVNSSSSQLSRILYSVSEQNVTLKSWNEGSLDIGQINKELKKLLQLANIRVWTHTSLEVRSMYVLSNVRQLKHNKEKLKSAIEKAWRTTVDASSHISYTLVSLERFVDSNWNEISKVSYTISVNSTDVEHAGVEQPSTDVVNEKLKVSLQKQQCGCTAKKLRKMYVKGKSLDIKKIHNSVYKTWKNSNNDVHSLGIQMKTHSVNRQKRETQPSGRLVNDQLEDISPAHYTVDVDGEEPNKLFVQDPANNDLDKDLKAVGSSLCNCEPKMSGTFPLDGHHKDSEKPKVVQAVREATVKNNPDVPEDELAVDVIMKPKNDSGVPLTDVTYLIGRNDDGDVEDIKIPSDVQLDSALSEKGLALHATKTDDGDDDDWIIPLAVALGIVAALLIICIVVYIVYRRRRQKMADLKQRGEDIQDDNVYDKEHFSEAAQFDNPVYDTLNDNEFHHK